MYIFQNNEVYILDNGNLVGVEIYPNKVVRLGVVRRYDGLGRVITKQEIDAKFHIGLGKSYRTKVEAVIPPSVTMPIPEITVVEEPKNEVVKHDTTINPKKSTRKSTRK